MLAFNDKTRYDGLKRVLWASTQCILVKKKSQSKFCFYFLESKNRKIYEPESADRRPTNLKLQVYIRAL